MALSEGYRMRQLRRIWNEVVTEYTNKSEWWHRRKTLEIYNHTYGEHADGDDLINALDSIGEYR